MTQKMWLATAAAIVFMVPALVAVSNGLGGGRWSELTPLWLGLALLAAAEAYGASDHANRDDADALRRTP